MSEVLINIDTFTREIQEKLYNATKDVCMAIRNEAIRNITDSGLVDTGIMRASITYDVRAFSNSIEGAVGTNLEYAIYVHEGTGLYAVNGNGRQQVPWVYRTPDGQYHSTKGQKPQPFLEDAVDEIMPNILAYYERVLT